MKIRISRRDDPFLMVPHAVSRMVGKGLSVDAFGALVRLLSLPQGSSWSVPAACKMLGVGKERWQRIARELRAVGAMVDDWQNDPETGRLDRCLALDWPGAFAPPVGREKRRQPGLPSAGKPGSKRPGKPSDGKPGSRSAQVIEIIDESAESAATDVAHIKKKKGASAAPSRGGALAPVAKVTSEAQERSPSSAGADLSPFVRSRLLAGQDVLVAGALVKAGTPEAARLCKLLRAQDAEKIAAASWLAPLPADSHIGQNRPIGG